MANTHWKTARRIARDARIELREVTLNPVGGETNDQGADGFAGEYEWLCLSTTGGSVSIAALAGEVAKSAGRGVKPMFAGVDLLGAGMDLANTLNNDQKKGPTIVVDFTRIKLTASRIDDRWFEIRIEGGHNWQQAKHAEIIVYTLLFIGSYNYRADVLCGPNGARIKQQWWKRPFVRRSTQKGRYRRAGTVPAVSDSRSRSDSGSSSYSYSGSSSGYESD